MNINSDSINGKTVSKKFSKSSKLFQISTGCIDILIQSEEQSNFSFDQRKESYKDNSNILYWIRYFFFLQ